MIPRLDAEERLAVFTDRAVATGLGKKQDRDRYLRGLESAARGGERQRAAKPSPAVLAAMGIGIAGGASEPSQEAMNDG